MTYKIDPVEYWVQRTIPQVYDDSLSFQELLAKVLAKLNEVVEETNEYFGKDLKVYVEEILTQWDADGTLDTAINDALFTSKADKSVVDKNVADLADRGVNLRNLGAKLDGATDDHPIIMNALAQYKIVNIPPGVTVAVSQAIVLNRGQALIGLSDNIRENGKVSKIKYIGPENRQLSVVQVGANAVGAEPSQDASDIRVKNLVVDGNYKAGFGVYGTYLTNETVVDNVHAMQTLEYGMYFARGWYASFTNLVARKNKGNGLAFGMPLVYMSGTKVDWVTASPLELNNCKIDNVRSHEAGQYFSVDNPGAYTPYSAANLRKGYGIGAGIGNGFRMNNFLSEKSGGVNLYVLTDTQPSKSIKQGYLESPAVGSGLDASSNMPNMLIEHLSTTGGSYKIEDIFMNYNSGGIFFIGVDRKVWLKDIQQPRFLKSLDGLSSYDLYKIVLKENVYYACGYSNTLENLAINAVQKTVNTRYSFEVPVEPIEGTRSIIFIKGDGTVPWGSYIVTLIDGTVNTYSFPALTTSFAMVRELNNVASITKGGGTGATDSNVTFKVITMPLTIN